MREHELKSTYMLAEDFENIIRRYYLAEGYEFTEPNAASEGKAYDFAVLSPSKEKILIEAKVFRTRVVQRAAIVRAVANLEAIRQKSEADRAVFFMSSAIAIPVTDTGTTEVVDVTKLSNMVSNYPDLVAELGDIVRILAPMPANDFDIHAYITFGDAYLAMREGPQPESRSMLESSRPEPQGAGLARALRAVPAGKKGARAFEDRCFDALRYIFSTHLANWSKQKVSDGGVSRFDLIARIASEHDFWKSIVGYFRSWYVVFEFKNFSQKITQGQIFTTEKYLYVGAMRTVAFIVSRKGPDKNALAVTRGSVREHGKLIVHLTIEDVCAMLTTVDTGDDPNALLFDRIDEMLMALER